MTTRNREICDLITEGKLSYQLIGERYGITRERVRQIANKSGLIRFRRAARASQPVVITTPDQMDRYYSKTDLSLRSLRLQLDYQRETGIWTWKNGPRAGQRAGSVSAAGYVQIRIDGKLYMAHVLAWLYSFDQWPTRMIDHVNRDPADNRLDNLRLATCSQNYGNTTKRRHNTSSFKGVTKHGNKWRAEIAHIKLGTFDTREEAAAAYAQAAMVRFGEHANPDLT